MPIYHCARRILFGTLRLQNVYLYLIWFYIRCNIIYLSPMDVYIWHSLWKRTPVRNKVSSFSIDPYKYNQCISSCWFNTNYTVVITFLWQLNCWQVMLGVFLCWYFHYTNKSQPHITQCYYIIHRSEIRVCTHHYSTMFPWTNQLIHNSSTLKATGILIFQTCIVNRSIYKLERYHYFTPSIAWILNFTSIFRLSIHWSIIWKPNINPMAS